MIHSSVLKNHLGELIDFNYHPAERKDTLVILGHGVTGNKDRPLLVALAEGLSALGWPCMRMSFAGNGDSGGRFENATITKECDDLESVLEIVPDYVRVVYAGHSMGAAVGVLTAAKDLRIRLLVSLAGMVHSAAFHEREFASVKPGEGCMWDEPEFPLSQEFASDMKAVASVIPAASQVTQPWLLVHGDADDLVPVQDSRDAYNAAFCSKRLLEIRGAGHSFDETSYPQIVSAMHQWIEHHG